jgi:hypothetical protein
MNREEMFLVHERKKKEFKEYISTFTEEVFNIFNLQEDALWEQSEYQSRYLATIAILIEHFGDGNSVEISKALLERVDGRKYYVKVDTDDADVIKYTLILEEDDIDANTNGRENLQA